MEKCYRVTLPPVARISLCKRYSSVLWLVHNPEIHVEVCGDRDSACSMATYIFINELQSK